MKHVAQFRELWDQIIELREVALNKQKISRKQKNRIEETEIEESKRVGGVRIVGSGGKNESGVGGWDWRCARGEGASE